MKTKSDGRLAVNNRRPSLDSKLDGLSRLHVNLMLSRSTMARSNRRSNSLDVGTRDLDAECQYLSNPSVQEYREMYEQEGVATRIVEVLAEESWNTRFSAYEDESDNVTTGWERAYFKLDKQLDLQHYFRQLDEQAGIGSFGLLLIGFDDGQDLARIVPGIDERGREVPRKGRYAPGLNVLYLRVYAQDMVKIERKETDPSNPRFGQPTLYRITIADPNAGTADIEGGDGVQKDILVHWSRVIHFADGTKGGAEVHGRPRLQNLHRRVFDIRKILGGAGEMFYKGGFPGLSFETDPSLIDTADIDLESLKKEIEAYSDGLQRYMRLVGMSAKSLAPQVADPTKHLMANYAYICATLAIPVRVFLGTLSGQEGAQQEDKNHKRRIQSRQEIVCTSRIIMPFLDRCMMTGVLPKPTQGRSIKIAVPDLNSLSEKDRADIALKKAQAVLQYVTSGSAKLIRPKQFFTTVLYMTPDEADAIIQAAGGEDGIMKELEKLTKANAGNTPNTSAKSPTARTGAGGRSNGLGRKAGNTTRSRNGGNAV